MYPPGPWTTQDFRSNLKNISRLSYLRNASRRTFFVSSLKLCLCWLQSVLLSQVIGGYGTFSNISVHLSAAGPRKIFRQNRITGVSNAFSLRAIFSTMVAFKGPVVTAKTV